MKLLLLGGTLFLGRHLARAARAKGHQVSVFHRGNHPVDPDLGLEDLLGDRDGNLKVLENRIWDAVIDTSGYVPRIVKASASLLARSAGHYTFLSSIAVYPRPEEPNLNESSPVMTMPDETVEVKTPQTYGAQKALCERVVEQVFPGRALNLRPGLLIGPDDPTDRFTYWPHRIARGGEVLAPGRPERQVQLLDARDLAAWIIDQVEAGLTGTYNAVGPAKAITMAEILDLCRTVNGRDVAFTWVSEDFLQEQKVAPYTDMPLWMPGYDDTVDGTKAQNRGLHFRPLANTLRDLIQWDRTRSPDTPRVRGLKPGRENELLSAWRLRSKVLV